MDDDFDEDTHQELHDLYEHRELTDPRRPRSVHGKIDPVTLFSDLEFKRNFRISKATFEELVEYFADELKNEETRGRPLSPKQQMAVALMYYASNTFQRIDGYVLGVSQPVVSRVVKRVSEIIVRRQHHFISLPSTTEMMESASSLESQFRIPNVALGVDGVFIRLDRKPCARELPSGVDPQDFFCRKLFYAINAMIIGDHNQLIRHVDARWAGRTHDSRVWECSSAKVVLEEQSQFMIAADSAYPMSSLILKPFSQTEAQTCARRRAFNSKLSAMRTRCTENMYAILKHRFPILKSGLRTSLATSLTIIKAVCCVHNFAMLSNDSIDKLEEDSDADMDSSSEQNEQEDESQCALGVRELGRLKRQEILESHF